MTTSWIVLVKDHTAAALGGAKVSLVEAGTAPLAYPYHDLVATFDESSPGQYQLSSDPPSEPGEWALVVSAPGKSSVLQRLSLKGASEDVHPAVRIRELAASVSVASEHVESLGAEVRRVVCTVTLYPDTEYVFLAGADPKGTSFVNFAKGRMEVLRQLGHLTLGDGKPNLGAVFTILSCPHRSTARFVRGRRGWLEIEEFGPEVSTKYGRSLAASQGDYGMHTAYKYLHHVGSSRPGSVRELSVFSHSWPGGPVLWNYTQSATFAHSEQRDPEDTEGRPKDFLPVNFVNWKDMPLAFSSEATFRVWGCFADSTYIGMMARARAKGRGDLELFEYRASQSEHDESSQGVSYKAATRELIQRLLQSSESYLAEAARALKVPVLGAPPGVGASMFTGGASHISVMLCDTVEYGSSYDYLAEEFPELELSIVKPTTRDRKTQFWGDLETHDQGYVNYQKALRIPPPAPRPFEPSIHRHVVSGQHHYTLLYFDETFLPTPLSASRVFDTLQSESILLHGQEGVRYVARKGKEQAAWFVRRDGNVFRLTADATGAFSVLGPIIRGPLAAAGVGP